MDPEKVTVILDKVAEGLGLKMFPSYPQFIVGFVGTAFRQENVFKPHLCHKLLPN